jgi:protein-disulfide isomerase
LVAIVLALGFVVVLALQNQTSTKLLSPSTTTPPALANGRELGSTAAPVVLDVWSDFQCPYCEQFWTASEPVIVRTFIETGQVRLVYHDFTFIGQESLDAAIAARCADRQGRFWQYHDLLFANQGQENSGAFSHDRLAALAAMADLDVATWQSCLSDDSVAQAITSETTQGQGLGVTGTPALFVNGAKVTGFDFPTVQAAIEGALPGTPSPGSSASAAPASAPGSATLGPSGTTSP